VEFVCILVLVFWYLALFQAGEQALKPRVKRHVAGTVNRLNVEHRTVNVDDAMLYRFYNKRTAEH